MAAGLQPFRNSIVRISSPGGGFVGLGYRFHESLILTCAHVAAEALGADPEAEAAPEGTLYVEHPFRKSSPGQAVGPAGASVEPRGWFPKGADAEPSDLALLRLREPQPPPSPLAELTGALSLAGSRFVAYGGIVGHQEDLAPIHGVVRDPIANGRWQLGTDAEYGIEPGCSGGPAADAETGETLGLIAQDERDPSIPAGFLIPARQIRQALERAGVEIYPAHRGLPNVRTWAKKWIPSPAYDEQQSVLRFIDYYAGRPGRPMPFAGRADELGRLDAWWDGESGSFLLVSGPAGMGKSALLLHWLAGVLDTREATGVLFLPVTIRFGTSDELSGLRLLHAQLAGVFVELRFFPEAKPDAIDYRAKIQEGWRLIASSPADRYLLVIDGADEAAGPWLHEGVLPYEIPENLAITLSARYKPGHEDFRPWLGDFTFGPSISIAEPLELGPLARDAVGEAITQLGHPIGELVDREGSLDELYRLTDRGDPLLVSLWAGQLWGERGRVLHLSVEDLAALEPSFGGFLDQWMEEQRRLWKRDGIDVHRDDIARLLGVLGVAHGPMRLADLLEVEGRLEASAPWDYRSARRVLDGADRLVVGDSERTGYTFVHPRLADEFRRRAERVGAGHTSIHRAFAEWGAEVVAALNTAEIEPEACPRYLLRHYTTHVVEIGLSEDETLERHLLPLLKRGWHKAWYADEGVYSGFLGDLGRVEDFVERINRASEIPVPCLGEFTRCVLIRSSISSLLQQLPAELVVSLVRSGLWSVERGLRLISEFEDQGKVRAILGLAAKAGVLVEGESAERALDILGTIRDEWERATGLLEVADHLEGGVRFQALQRALQVAEKVAEERKHVTILATAARHLEEETRHETLERASGIAQEIEDASNRAWAWWQIAGCLSGKARREALKQTLTATLRIEDLRERGGALARLASDLAGYPELLDRALREGVRLADTPYQSIRANLAQLFAVAAVHLDGEARNQPLEQTFRAMEEIEDDYLLAQALVAVAGEFHGMPNLLTRAFELALRIRRPSSRAQALAAVATYLEGEAHDKAVDLAIRALEDLEGESKGAEALAAVGKILDGRPDLLDRVLRVAEGIKNEEERVRALKAIGASLEGHPDLLKRAVQVAERIEDRMHCAVALAALAGHLHGKARYKAVDQALLVAEEVDSGWRRTMVLATVAIAVAGQPELLVRTLRLAQEIGDEKARTEALATLDCELSGEDLQDAADRAGSPTEQSTESDPFVRSFPAFAALITGRLEGEVDQMHRLLQALNRMQEEWLRSRVSDGEAEEIWWKALELALDVLEPVEHDRTLGSERVVVSLKTKRDLLERAVEAADEAHSTDDCLRILEAIANHLEGHTDLLDRALRMWGVQVGSIPKRAKTMAALGAQLHGDARHHALERAFRVAEGASDESARAEALAAVADWLRGDEELLVRAFEASLKPSTPGSDLVGTAAEILKKIAPDARRLQRVLSAAGELPRNECLEVVTSLLSMIREVGEVQAVHQMRRAILETGAYWP